MPAYLVTCVQCVGFASARLAWTMRWSEEQISCGGRALLRTDSFILNLKWLPQSVTYTNLIWSELNIGGQRLCSWKVLQARICMQTAHTDVVQIGRFGFVKGLSRGVHACFFKFLDPFRWSACLST